MKQLSFFSTIPQESATWRLFVDGAARNNPGPAGAGMYLLHGDKMVSGHGYFLGNRTNNQAEYLALILGLLHAHEQMKQGDILDVYADSELLVKQMHGQYRVKDLQLKELFVIAQELLLKYPTRISHVRREQNKEADKLANQGIDQKHLIPPGFAGFLHDRCSYM